MAGCRSSLAVDIAGDFGRRRRRALLGEFDRRHDLGLDAVAHGSDLLPRHHAILLELAFKAQDRIAREPGGDLLLGAVSVAIAPGVAPDPIGLALDQRGSLPAPGTVHGRE